MLIPWAIAMTRLRLNTNTIGSASLRITSNIRPAALASASIRHWPSWNVMPPCCSLVMNAVGTGGASVVVSHRREAHQCAILGDDAVDELERAGDATQVVEAATGHEHYRNTSTPGIRNRLDHRRIQLVVACDGAVVVQRDYSTISCCAP